MLNTLDQSNMYGVISSFPDQFQIGLDLAANLALTPGFDSVIVTGMGGSSLPADVVNCVFASQIPQPLITSRGYTIERHLTEKTLVIASSFSGNTEETIASYKQAIISGAKVVVIASGGELLRLAILDSIPYVTLPVPTENFQPRMASGYHFGILSAILMQIGWLEKTVYADITQMSESLRSFNLEISGRQLGESLVGTIPVIYAADQYLAVARVGKIKFNENSKVPAFWNVFPELNHNEMVGFSGADANYRIIMLRDPEDEARINNRMAATADLLRDSRIGVKATIWDMVGANKMEKVFASLVTLDWASYYLALSRGVDPTPVKIVEDFKQIIKLQSTN